MIATEVCVYMCCGYICAETNGSETFPLALNFSALKPLAYFVMHPSMGKRILLVIPLQNCSQSAVWCMLCPVVLSSWKIKKRSQGQTNWIYLSLSLRESEVAPSVGWVGLGIHLSGLKSAPGLLFSFASTLLSSLREQLPSRVRLRIYLQAFQVDLRSQWTKFNFVVV